MNVAVIFDSGYGHTARVAQAVAEGVHAVPDTTAHLIQVGGVPTPWNLLERSDAIIFESPTYSRPLRKLFHFARNNRESHARSTSSCRFDGRVQSQQIGLLG